MRFGFHKEKQEPTGVAERLRHRREGKVNPQPRSDSTADGDASAASTDSASKWETISLNNNESCIRQNRWIACLCGIVSILVLLMTGASFIGPPLRIWQRGVAHIHEQFALLDESVSMLASDTMRVQKDMKDFLTQCQKLHVSSTARTDLVVRVVTQSYQEQAKARFNEHGTIMKKAMAYHALQERRIDETKERLRKMNITIPIQIVAQVESENETDLPVKLQIPEQQEDNVAVLSYSDAASSLPTFDQFVKAVVDMEVIMEESRQYHDNRRNIIGSRHVPNTEEGAFNEPSVGSFFFYALIASLTGGYIYTALCDEHSQSRSWSPMPAFLIRLKDLLTSCVVVEDLRVQAEEVQLGNVKKDEEETVRDYLIKHFWPQRKHSTHQPTTTTKR